MMRLALALSALVAALLGGCRPEVGDSCKLSTDCSITGDRLCDTSQPDGYCTIFNCDPGSCPDEAVCVEFHRSAERFSRRFCVRECEAASDCREGYVCVDPKDRDGVIFEGRHAGRRACLP